MRARFVIRSLLLLSALYLTLWLSDSTWAWIPPNHPARGFVHAPTRWIGSADDPGTPAAASTPAVAPAPSPSPSEVEAEIEIAQRAFLDAQGEPGRFRVSDRVAEYGLSARARLRPWFERAGVPYPPARLVLVGLKRERRLELWAAGNELSPPKHIRNYIILGASGGPGPKLRQGDRQVPEGLYRLRSLNPNSAIHLSLRVDYPNEEDRAIARAESRTNLGGDIMVHGGHGSIGCLAIGDPAIEEIFVLTAETGVDNTQLILAPWDLRWHDPPGDPGIPVWMGGRYQRIRQALVELGDP